MNLHSEKAQEDKSKAIANEESQKQGGGVSAVQFVDNRPEAIAQRKLQEMANNSPQANKSAQLQARADNHSAQQQQSIQKAENNTGLPDNLKAGIENLSGSFMDDVNVHYNSDKPAQLQAHAYAQGTDIHVAPGQEKHLPHEVWHVAQQKQGREAVMVDGNASLDHRFGPRLRATAWRFAKTMPENPHWYIVETWDRSLFDAMSTAIREYGYDKPWRDGRSYRYLNIGCWTYWIIEDILNRKPIDLALIAGQKALFAVALYSASNGLGTKSTTNYLFDYRRPLPEPDIQPVTMSVEDTGSGGNVEFTSEWVPNAAITNALHDVRVTGGLDGGVQAALSTEANALTVTSEVATHSGGGTGVARDFWIQTDLLDSSGNVIKSWRVNQEESTV